MAWPGRTRELGRRGAAFAPVLDRVDRVRREDLAEHARRVLLAVVHLRHDVAHAGGPLELLPAEELVGRQAAPAAVA